MPAGLCLVRTRTLSSGVAVMGVWFGVLSVCWSVSDRLSTESHTWLSVLATSGQRLQRPLAVPGAR